MVTALDKSQLLGRVDALKQALTLLPPTETLQKAVYHCERLHIAVRTSHQEGTRFADPQPLIPVEVHRNGINAIGTRFRIAPSLFAP